MRGSYILLARLERDAEIRTKARSFSMGPGYYAYVGSAMGGLEARIRRHMSSEKGMRWHIDYLLQRAELVEVFRLPSDNKEECALSREVEKISDGSVKGFGCSDCSCKSHLYYFRENPEAQLLRACSRMSITP